MKSNSNLEKLLASGKFAVTSELGPPKGTDVAAIEKKAGYLKGKVDAVNITDNQTAIVRMSSIATSKILIDLGLEPVMQMVSRDRNRLAMQSDLFGAYALGIRNVLCLTGDHQKFGNHPQAKGVFDLDSIQMLKMVKAMRDEGKVLCGDEISGGFEMFIGAAANPFGDPFVARVPRLAKKAEAGADFIQTQCIFDMDRFSKWLAGAVDRGLDKKVHILAGVTPLKSAGMANYMNKNVAGINVPEEIIERLKGVAKEKQADEGIKICVEQIQQIKEMKGISGIHLMAIEWEHRVPEILELAGLLPRPVV
ncbi:MAG TPA: methylenetetrahydrofolate reductase [bacterium]|nr:methylenetetrahydrofolate reductase [bacterium]